jgi:hypothetical protein
MGKDPLEYARARLDIAGATIRGLPDKVVKEGQGYQRARQAFDMLLYEIRRAGAIAAKFVGGHSIHRDHRGDPNARPPIVPIPAAKQREALKLVCDRIFTGTAMQISPEALRYLAVGRWYHWGSTDPDEDPEYPIHDRILQVQLWTLFEILNPRTLSLVRDAEARIPEGEDALTTPELLSILTDAIWSEAKADATGNFTNRKPYISTVRRNLQQEYAGQLIDLALEGDSGASPPCARTQAWQQLGGLAARIQATLSAADQGKIVLDDYSRGHLLETGKRIQKALDASYSRNAASGGGGGVIISVGSPAGER